MKERNRESMSELNNELLNENQQIQTNEEKEDQKYNDFEILNYPEEAQKLSVSDKANNLAVFNARQMELTTKRAKITGLLAQNKLSSLSKSAMEKQLREINNAREQYGVNLAESEMKSLESMKGRYAAKQLLDMGGIFDSTEMADVQLSVKNLENSINILLHDNKPMSKKKMDDLLGMYELAMEACRYYCANRNSTRSSGIRRKQAVEEMLSMLGYEKNILTLHAADIAAGNAKSLPEIMHLSVQKGRVEENTEKEGLSKGKMAIAKILNHKTKPVDKIKKLDGKKRTAKQNETIALIKKLREIPADGTHAATLIIEESFL